MRTFKFSNPQNTVVVEVETDSISDTQDNLTIHDINFIKGSANDIVALGFSFDRLPTTRTALIAFAATYNLNLSIVDGQAKTSTSANASTELAITTTSPLTGGTSGVAYSATLEAEGGNIPYVWSVDSGDLPAGVTLSSLGVLSGTPTETGEFIVTYKVTDRFTQTATAELSLTIS